ncbi:uncharacterized protein LOC120249487 isoform X2 [Dioscorea cayenensis subsp. rotundata]|uniref:Uncharacterized protein LOC120249487 isoform X2 n=1 Tax=Dioscorea cayennensis subsp. rotundata TaxID=55577 RepID=A0AB40AGJ9_DIOCR|nr:uncharacterized protein LOC120249487 isoform X2 [Dioscorea cayenensis subsp. rotundata]
MFPFGRHAPQPSPPAYSGLSAFAPPFNLGYANSDHPYPSSPAASSTPIPPSPCVGPYHSYYPPPPSSSGASMTSFGADFGGAGLNRWDESYYGNYGSNSAWMDHQPNLDSLMFGKDSLARKGHYGSECSGLLDEKHPSIFEKHVKPAYSGTLLFGQTGMTEGMPKQPDPFAVPDRGNAFDFHSSNRGLMDEFGSLSAASILYEPPATSSSNHLFVPPPTAIYSSEYNSIPRNEHSTVHDRTLFDLNDDYTHQHTGQGFSLFHAFTCGNALNSEMSRAPNDVKEPTCIPGYLTPVQRDCSSDNESVTGKSMQCAVDISDLRARNLDSSDSLNSNSASAEPVSSMQTFLEALDHHNLAVDSPCWKGASGSQQSPFSVGKVLETGFVIKESERSNELQHSKNHFLNMVHSEAMPSAKREGNLISNENNKHSLCSLVDLSLLFDLPSEHQKANNVCKAKCSGLDNAHEQGFKAGGICGNESISQGHCEPNDTNGKSVDHEISHVANESSISERLIDTEKDFTDSVKASACGFDSCVGAQTVIAPKFSLPGCVAETFGSSDEPGNFSSSDNNVQLFLKTMHSLSEVLLNTDCIDSNELKEHDYKLLQVIIWNLEHFSLKSKKEKSEGSSNISGVDTDAPDVALSKLDGMIMSNNRTRCNIPGEMHNSGCGLDDNLLDKSVPTSGTTASIADYIGHALDKINTESPLDQEENLQTKFYKKLWIDAEIASCAIKYELQLLRMNAEIENHKYKSKESLAASYLSAKPTEFPRTLFRDSLHVLDEVEGTSNNVKESLSHDASELEDNIDGCCDINSHEAFPSTIAGLRCCGHC